jgi:acyl-CoA synthetase (AMP-forming)/AMP-acid ligase II/acyl carrier protein
MSERCLGARAGIAIDTIGSLLRNAAQRSPESTALSAPNRPSLSYVRLWHQVEGVVAWLNAHGIGRGDRVAIVLPNGPELASAFLGVSAGAVSAPLNPGYGPNEFRSCLADLRPRALIVESGIDSPAIAIARASGITVIQSARVDHEEAGVFTLNGDALIGRDGGRYSEWNDPALVLHTSGTTARPKIVPLSQANLLMSAQNIATSLSLSADDRCLNVMPLFHIHGLVAGLLASLRAHATVTCTPGFAGDSFFGWLNEFCPSWYTAVPTMHQEILRRAPEALDIIARHRLRFIRSSSAALAPQTMTELEAVFRVPVVEAYGMTEAAHQIASNPLPPDNRVPGSVGIATGCEVAIMDEHGTLLPADHAGEVVIRGQNVTGGYENNPAVNAQAFVNGWFRTGDRGVIDDQGYVSLTGRLKEIINRGGEKIAPREIDEVLLRHPDVREAAAFAMPHATLGEAIGAAVVPRKGASLKEVDVRAFAFTQLPDFKVPARIVILTEIPRGPTGKVYRTGLATLLAAELTVAYDRPAQGLEQLSAALFEEVLQRTGVGRHDNFFALGGDSLRAMQVAARLISALGMEIPSTMLFHHPTPASLAADLARLQQDDDLASLAVELQELPEGKAGQLLQKAARSDA